MYLRRGEHADGKGAATNAAAHEECSRSVVANGVATARVFPIHVPTGDEDRPSPRPGDLAAVSVAAKGEVELAVADDAKRVGRMHQDDARAGRGFQRPLRVRPAEDHVV